MSETIEKLTAYAKGYADAMRDQRKKDDEKLFFEEDCDCEYEPKYDDPEPGFSPGQVVRAYSEKTQQNIMFTITDGLYSNMSEEWEYINSNSMCELIKESEIYSVYDNELGWILLDDEEEDDF